MCGELGNGSTSKVETHGYIKKWKINIKSRVLGVAPPRVKDPNLHAVRHDH